MPKTSWFDRFPRHLGIIWLVVFGYTIVAGLIIQLILLPYVFPAWHGHDGLFNGMDGPMFHRLALELSQRIEADGWGAWEMAPDRQFVSGIAAIAYVIIYPAPWSVLPINGALSATAGVFLILMLDNLMLERRRSILAALPFLFFPSALLWNAQFHNDNYAVPGVILILYGWSILAGRENETPNKLQARAAVCIGIGSFLLGLVRNEILFAMLGLCLIVSLALGLFTFLSFLQRKTTAASFLVKLLNLGLAATMMAIITSATLNRTVDNTKTPVSVKNDDWRKGNGPAPDESTWEYTPWLPRMVDDQLKEVVRIRKGFVVDWAASGSGIDLDVRIVNATDLAIYLPRALQIGFFSPFPNLWFTKGNKKTGAATRAGAAFEMSFAYFCLLGLPFFIWKSRKQPALRVIVFLCTAMLLLYAVTVPNVGALYRFRYPYFMSFVCMGSAGWLTSENKNLLKFFSRRTA